MLQHSDYSADYFCQWVQAQRHHTLDYILRQAGSDDRGPHNAELNPPLWEWCHLVWFWEYWCLRQHDNLQPPLPSLIDHADLRFNSALIAHQQRWHCDLPTWTAALAYGDAVLQAVLGKIISRKIDLYFVELAIHHEAMHEENFMRRAQCLRQAFRATPPYSLAPNSTIHLPSQTIRLGQHDSTQFGFDNEYSAHEIALTEFQISNNPVSETEFAEFVMAGGYQNADWWSDAGWQWRQQQQAVMPLYWHRNENEFSCREFTQWRALSEAQALRYVNFYEAQAYANYRHARLPRAAEWQAASAQFSKHALWEWSADTFAPYPNFVPGPYQEYSSPSFGHTQELRGSSPLAQMNLMRPTFRNFFSPQRRDVCAGFRLAW